ncbi:MAG: right-handed parallel beta-helix repeat-containing protein [Draconibacterium sp.]|nr:right-handed parallel beta-helix repeat-containing protein [Draconibacterium sp.]
MRIILTIVASFIMFIEAQSRIIIVHPGDDLNKILNNTIQGDTVLVKPGVYKKVFLKGKRFTKQEPLVIKADGGGDVVIKGDTVSSGSSLEISFCSYVAVDGFTLTNSMWGIYVKNSDHVALKNNEIYLTGQEGCHVGRSSKYVDVVGNEIHHTGLFNPKWAEGIYIGSGSYWERNPFPDNCEYIWIEGNHIYETGKAEAINVKGESFHVTVRNNNIHDIHPGTSEQYNQAAITVEGCENSLNNNYRINEKRDVGVENNIIKNVSGGYLDWNNGIMFFGTGVYVLNNTVSGCTNIGIYGSNWKNLGLVNYVYENTITDCGTSMEIQPEVKVRLSNPGKNPHSPQEWYYGIKN